MDRKTKSKGRNINQANQGSSYQEEMVTKQVGTFVLCFFTEERKYGVVKTEMIRDLYELVSQDATLEPQMGLSSVDLWTVDWPERKGGTTKILKCPAILIEHSDDRKFLDNLGKRMQKSQMFPSSRKSSDGGDTESGTSNVSDQLTATNTDMTEAQASTNISKIGKRGTLKDVLAELKKRRMEKEEEMDVSPPKDPPKLEDLRKENRHLKEELEKAKAKVDLFKLTPQLVKQLREMLDRQAESSPVSSLPFSDYSCESTSASPKLPSCTPSRPSSPTTSRPRSPSSPTTPSPTSPVLTKPPTFDRAWENAVLRVFTTDPKRFLGDLLIAKFGKDFLSTHSFSGMKSSHPSCHEKEPKPGIPSDTLPCLRYALVQKFGSNVIDDDKLRSIVKWKLNNCSR